LQSDDATEVAFQNKKGSFSSPVAQCGHFGEKGVLGWPKRYKLAHAFRWGYSYKTLMSAQFLGQVGVCLTSEGHQPFISV
jgi:hypothetical protein